MGVEFTRSKDGTITLKKEFLIERIISSMGFQSEMSNGKHTLAVKPNISKYSQGPPRKHDWNYRYLIVMLNYLDKTSRVEINFSVHQCARFCENPRLLHERAVHRIVRYFIETKTNGFIFKPDNNIAIECWVDADFSGNWSK